MYNDDDGCGGCLTLFIVCAILCWLTDNWVTILLVVLGIAAIIAAVIGVKSYNDKKPEREAKAREKAEQEEEERIRRERESYDRYFSAQEGAELSGKLDVANAVVRKLFEEKDPAKRQEIFGFFDKYLPVMTEIIEASKHGGVISDESIGQFTQAAKTFSKNLYRADEVVDLNSSLLESMAVSDGLYDPYEKTFALEPGREEEPPEKEKK